MNIQKYQELAARTLPHLSNNQENVTHMIYGMLTELGELADVYKKNIAYNKHLDEVNIKEELGDIMWYWAGLCTLQDFNPSQILETNIAKLKIRYPEKFTEDLAINRNLEAERRTLENDYDKDNSK